MPIPGLPFTDEALFKACNVVIPCWVLLFLVPWWKPTKALVWLASIFLSGLYGALILPYLIETKFDFSVMASLPGVAALLSNPSVVLAAWVHYCVADLWVGQWIALDAATRQIPRLLMAPVMLLAFLLGPVGLGAYLILRKAFTPKLQVKSRVSKSD
eukprot:CAMPEP_0119109036 /NCGR_PEP_ID=MMETSP1180-20130426/16888_1 /TAXON_ID=3052 ORGANISM="Chlamydomonas cf sp, Strain CCMP681" /NCGR_SAMPLE_ID=MMETSP1180 /ASSEMBLY_ACC=CAM_ASM_000741 /LENGTH=156 /DNA_ID=CAMNT_0007094733 /DNA_START=30 /DNA_END=500 /DNA_ORIENTATION=-